MREERERERESEREFKNQSFFIPAGSGMDVPEGLINLNVGRHSVLLS